MLVRNCVLTFNKKCVLSNYAARRMAVREYEMLLLDEINTSLTDIRENLTKVDTEIDILSDQVDGQNNTKDLDVAISHFSLRVFNNSLMEELWMMHFPEALGLNRYSLLYRRGI